MPHKTISKPKRRSSFFKKHSDLEKLKALRKNINGIVERDKVQLVRLLDDLVSGWDNQLLPNLQDYFRHEEIDWFLSAAVINVKTKIDRFRLLRLVRMLINNGYRDQPPMGKDGKPVLRRTTPIHRTVKSFFHRDNSMLSELFKVYDRFDLNYIDAKGVTHFHLACESGCNTIVSKFLEYDQDPDCPVQKSVDPPLHVTLNLQHVHVLELLLRYGANPNVVNIDGLTPLHVIGKINNNDDLAIQFFQMNDDHHRMLLINAQDNLGRTPLYTALTYQHWKLAELLLRRDADPNIGNAEGSTPLHVICLNNQSHDSSAQGLRAIAQLLMERGADPNRTDVDGYTPLHVISKHCSDSYLANVLFDVEGERNQPLSIDASDKLGRTPLHLALRRGNIKMAEWLLINDADPNLAKLDEITRDDDRDKFGNTILHLAVTNGLKLLPQCLLSKGADPNSTNKKGKTPLHIICSRDDLDYDRFIETFFRINRELARTVQVDAQDYLGQTPLHLALIWSHKMAVESLLKNGANPNLADAKGSTPLHIISRQYNNDFATMLFDISHVKYRPLQVNARDASENTPLHLALLHHNQEMVEFLLRKSANPNLTNAEGSTSLHIICQNTLHEDARLTDLFFRVNDEMGQTVLLEIRNNFGQTPLLCAMKHIMPFTVATLLNRGADPSSLFERVGERGSL